MGLVSYISLFRFAYRITNIWGKLTNVTAWNTDNSNFGIHSLKFVIQEAKFLKKKKSLDLNRVLIREPKGEYITRRPTLFVYVRL